MFLILESYPDRDSFEAGRGEFGDHISALLLLCVFACTPEYMRVCALFHLLIYHYPGAVFLPKYLFTCVYRKRKLLE